MKTFQTLLDETRRVQYTNKDVVNFVKPREPQKIELFTIGKYISDDELEREADKQGFVLAHPYALTLYAKENPDFDKDKLVGTHWQDVLGNWCFVAFRRWYGKRHVLVHRHDGDWLDFWWFAGVRKSLVLESKSSSPESLRTLPLRKETSRQALTRIADALEIIASKS